MLAYINQRYNLDRFLPFNIVPRYAGIAFERQCPAFMELIGTLEKGLTEYSYEGRWNGTKCADRRMMYFSKPVDRSNLVSILNDFWNRVLLDVLRHQKKDIIVEDNTWSNLFFDTILELMPNAKLVNVVRDPRDIIASYIKMRWAPKDTAQAVNWFKGIHKQWYNVRSRVDPNCFIEVKLEDLVKHTELTLRLICEFWDIEWHPNLLITDLSKSNTGRWKIEFSDKEKLFLEGSLETELIETGYV